MTFPSQQALHRRAHVQKPVPAGFNIAYDGLAATAAALDNWDIADGGGETVNLCADVIPIGKNATYSGAGGDDFSNVSVSVDSQGGHTGSTSLAQSYTSLNNNIYTYARASAGVHTHTLLCDNVSYSPPHKPLIFIQANRDTQLPEDGVFWIDNTEVPADCSAFADIQDRFIRGTPGDGRAVAGSDDMEFDLTSFSTSVSHHHNPTRSTASAGGNNSYNLNSNQGAHPHADQVGEVDAVTPPPYIALLGVKADKETGAFRGLVGYYNGDLGDLPSGWYEGNGDGETRDCRGRMIRGSGGFLSLGDTGGDMGNVTVEATITTRLVNHNHGVFSGLQVSTTGGYHYNYNWYHGHTATAENKKQPKWHGLPTVFYLP